MQAQLAASEVTAVLARLGITVAMPVTAVPVVSAVMAVRRRRARPVSVARVAQAVLQVMVATVLSPRTPARAVMAARVRLEARAELPPAVRPEMAVSVVTARPVVPVGSAVPAAAPAALAETVASEVRAESVESRRRVPMAQAATEVTPVQVEMAAKALSVLR